jgi:hypothetical protein
MKINDAQIRHYKEQTETRVVDLLRQFPELDEQAGNRLLGKLGSDWASCQCPVHEFMYHLAWLGCERISEMSRERDEINEQLGFEPDEGDYDDEQVPA